MLTREQLVVLTAVWSLAALTGCGSQPQEAEIPPEPVVAVVPHIKPDLGPAPTAPPTDIPNKESATSPKPTPTGTTPFQLPDDDGGKKVAAVLLPTMPPIPDVSGTAGPKPRSSAVERGDVPWPAVVATVPTLPQPKATGAKPTPPPERVPAELGQSVALDPGQVRLPDPPRIRGTPAPPLSAVDVPILATPLPSRASVNDPTAELSAARVVMTQMPLPFSPGWFVRFGIPDPFEIAAQVRGKTGAPGELGTAPVIVSPAKP